MIDQPTLALDTSGYVAGYDRTPEARTTRHIANEMFNEHGQLRPHVRRRIRREQRREWIRSWRPRLNIRVRFMLFPKTQRRLEELERQCATLRKENKWLRDDVKKCIAAIGELEAH